jgi:uncharacterized RDD family membrane protein YckC
VKLCSAIRVLFYMQIGLIAVQVAHTQTREQLSGPNYSIILVPPSGWVTTKDQPLDSGYQLVVDTRGEYGSIRIVTHDLINENSASSNRRKYDRQLEPGRAEVAKGAFQDILKDLESPRQDVVSFAGLTASHLSGTQKAQRGISQNDYYLMFHNGILFLVVARLPGNSPPSEALALQESLKSIEIVRQYAQADSIQSQRFLPLGIASIALVVLYAVWVVVTWRIAVARNRKRSSHVAIGTAELDPNLATTGQRLLNYLVDTAIVAAITVAFAAIFGLVLGTTAALIGVAVNTDSVMQIAAYAIYVASLISYYGGLEGISGATVGKLITRTRAVLPDQSKIGYRKAYFRALCRLIPLDRFSYFGGKGHPIGWHDSASGTVVVRAVNTGASFGSATGGQNTAEP